MKKFFEGEEKPGETAKQRLQIMLRQDRLNVKPEIMEQIKDDIVAVLIKYFDINEEEIMVALEPNEKAMVLSTSLPVIRLRKPEEYEKKEEKKTNTVKKNNIQKK